MFASDISAGYSGKYAADANYLALFVDEAEGAGSGPASPLNWVNLEYGNRPAFADEADWINIWTRFEAQGGTNVNSLDAALSQAATTLSHIGDPTADVTSMVSYELE